MRPARHDDARGLAAEQTVPKYRSCARFCPDVAECGTRQPRSIKKAFEYCGHPDPPHRIHNNEMVGRLDEFLKTKKVGFALLFLPIPFVEHGVELHLSDIHAGHVVPRLARCRFICIGKCSAHAALIGMPEEHEYLFPGHASLSNSPTSSRLPTLWSSIARRVFILK